MGTEIYYTGDRANVDGFGKITDVKVTRWGTDIYITMEDGRTLTVTPTAFEVGVGRRFYTKAKYQEERNKRIEQMKRDMGAINNK